jgi:hypothetical protein
VETRQVVWSATTCDFPGAGLYLGLAPWVEHVTAARRLTSRQLKVFTGARVQMRKDADTWPLNYFAVRDPSAVKVIRLDKPPLPNGFRHVRLAVQLERGQGLDPAVWAFPPGMDALPTPGTAAFVLTIGLPIPKEESFFRDAVAGHSGQDWGDIYRRMQDLGCREVSDDEPAE